MRMASAAMALAAAPAARAAAQKDGGVDGLPLVEARAAAPTHTLAFLVSGDGDWAATDRTLARELNERRISVVGLKSRSYLSRQRTPEQAAADAGRVLRHYLAAWQADSVVVIGFSRGADVAPFMVRRLPPDLRGRVRLMALLSPSATVGFLFHWSDLVMDVRRPGDLPVLPEVTGLSGVRVMCVYGADDAHSLCPTLPARAGEQVRMDGGHHLGGDTQRIATLIAAEMGHGSME
ncbi:MAG TPA: AcvB/VirJ family lysyl-phosphatidylglycerol hydrolase [Longimicrobium sp.]|nr:AcvB/VirJ family lysyl-phosphatidylglycerol hydrolase [Longimicrobium sp.]